mgnify:CR=1 FL=1
MFKIFTTNEFENDFKKLDNSEQIRVKKILKQLKEQGGDVGKPLGLSSFREKKFDGKRLYYLVYENMLVILLLGISDKKTQQATINKILMKIEEYRHYILEMLRNN